MIIRGDSLEELRKLDENSVDAVVTDPPYGLSFMGKKWDYDVPSTDLWLEVLRVLKPGGHLLSFGGTRTYHRMVLAIEDAGFEIRDQLQWIHGSGFPKSHNLGDGWGTALKPANEPIVLARKPLSESTVAKNVLKHGTGALNIDGSRIEASDQAALEKNWDRTQSEMNESGTIAREGGKLGAIDLRDRAPQGRWPANVLLDEEAAAMLDEQSGHLVGAGNKIGTPKKSSTFFADEQTQINMKYDNGGGASRFFYVAKASKRERNAGLEGMPEKDRPLGISQWSGQTNGSGEVMGPSKPQQNSHPTVKPIKLMEYLCKLITPPGGIILDPFMGSGTTGCAAVRLGYQFIGIEREAEYVDIAEKRIEHAAKTEEQLSL